MDRPPIININNKLQKIKTNYHYLKKCIKYNNKYQNLLKDIQMAGKKPRRKSLYRKKKLPKFLSVFLSLLKFGTEEIPIIGQAESLI